MKQFPSQRGKSQMGAAMSLLDVGMFFHPGFGKG